MMNFHPKLIKRKITMVLAGILCCILTVGLGGITLSQEAESPPQDTESARSYPPDTTPYIRDKVPEDDRPGGKPAIPPGHLRAPKKPAIDKEPVNGGTEAPGPENETRSGTNALGANGAAGQPGICIADTVVDNSDADLADTDMENDGETTIAINPADPNEIVIAAFSGPGLTNPPGSWNLGAQDATIYHSLDGGVTWSVEGVPPPVGITVNGVNDWTFDYGRNDQLSAAVLNNGDVVSVTTTDPANLTSWLYNNDATPTTEVTNVNTASSIGNADQPWLLTNPDPGTPSQDNVYVAYDDFSGSPDMQVAVSLGQNPPDFTVDVMVGASTGGVNPGLRMAKDPRTGFIYALWQQCVTNCTVPGTAAKDINYLLNRSTDGGATWTLDGNSLGIIVAAGDSFQPRPIFGTVNALLGGINHAGVDPNTGTLYYVYGDRDNDSGVQRLALVRVTVDGMGMVNISTPSFVSPDVNDAAIPSVAVVDNGTLGVFYYTFDGFSSDPFPMFTAWLALSTDQGDTFTQHRLLTFLSSATATGNQRQRVLGDYMQMKAMGNCFYGSFTGNGAPFGRPISNHDPIFFKTCVPPVAQCNAPANITPLDAPISFTASTQDNCGVPVEVTEFDCFKFTKKGKRIDKTGSCQVAIDGDTITILDSGGVDDHITWTVQATDVVGNVSTRSCKVEVVNPGKKP